MVPALLNLQPHIIKEVVAVSHLAPRVLVALNVHCERPLAAKDDELLSADCICGTDDSPVAVVLVDCVFRHLQLLVGQDHIGSMHQVPVN